MDQEQSTIGYDEFMTQPIEERTRICLKISPENRAQVMKTHVVRWLEANRHRLTPEQVVTVEEFIPIITPEAYRPDRDSETLMRQVDELMQKAEAVFTREELRQIVSDRADHVPAIIDR